MSTTTFRRVVRAVVAALILLTASTAAHADTLMMPKRDGLRNQALVVWGVTTQANLQPFTLTFGDGTQTTGTVTDRSYIAVAHTYANAGTYTVKLTVGTEEATVEVRIFDPATLPGGVNGEAARGLRINMAIENGLRYLWTTQANRGANFPAGLQTSWTQGAGWPQQWTALVALAFQNHGYRLPNNASAPTGIYERFIVRRALNYVFAHLATVPIASQPSGFAGQPVRNPCVGLAVNPCVGLAPTSPDRGYATGIAMLPLAGSGALDRVNSELGPGATNPSHNMTYREILQRMSNALAWGQTDPDGAARGGWGYNFNQGNFDGSTVGWALLGLMDAEAAGIEVPSWVKSEFAFGLTGALNNNGSLDYGGDGNAAAHGNPNLEKAGVGLQGMFFIGEIGSARSNLTRTYISDRWNTGRIGGDYAGWSCGAIPNRGCGYAMFNNFKGLKLQNIQTLPGVNRPAGPGAIPANDWYADYQDWLVNNQTNPSGTAGGHWAGMIFSPIANSLDATAALAELILSPVALVLPDPGKFSTVGLSPAFATAVELNSHTVTAHAESSTGTPVAGATVVFNILSGPNAGLTGTGNTDAAGDVSFTYTDAAPIGTVGTDRIRASIGVIDSNVAEMVWTLRNRPPVANDDTFSTDEDTQLPANVITTGSPDNDPDGDTMQAILVTGVSSGSLALNPDGSFLYTPHDNFCGGDSFSYKLNDGTVDSNVAIATITVNCINDPPVAADGSATIGEDTPVDGTLTSSDIDGGAPKYTVAAAPAHGSVVLNEDTGVYTYTPALNYHGSDSFSFSVADGNGGTDAGDVSITVTPVNDAPAAADGSATTNEDTAVTGQVTSTDVDGPAAVYSVATPPAHGSVLLDPNGTYTYTPAENYNGPDSFTFMVIDGAGGSDTGVVSINVMPVNDAPFCAAAQPNVGLLWPPDHQLQTINVLGVTDPVEGSAIAITIDSIWQDEPTNTVGDGNTPVDGYGVGTAVAQVRAERSGNKKVPGDGRTYYINFTGTDAQGGSCTGTVKVGVPHDQGNGNTVGEGGPLYKSTGS